MFKPYGFVIMFFTCSVLVYAQTRTIDDVLQEIEQNNKEIQAYSAYIKSKTLLNKSENNLKNPELSVYYLPWGETQEGNYNEIQLTQQFEFPTVYSKRNALNTTKEELNKFLLAQKKQNVLFEAKTLCIELFYINRQLQLEQNRLKQAKIIHDQIGEKFNQQEINILEFNKSKLDRLQKQFTIEDLQTQKQALLLQLKALNNGISINVEQLKASVILDIPDQDKLWQSIQQQSPELIGLTQSIEVAKQQVNLQKAKRLPDITLGINQQSVPNSTHLGVYSGLSIPLWENKHKVRAAITHLKYEETTSEVGIQHIYTNFTQTYTSYQALLQQYRVYDTILKDIESESLLLESYQLGEISFSEYYLEVQFYRDTFDRFLGIEQRLKQLRASLLKHQL